jgi:hypothetical protein
MWRLLEVGEKRESGDEIYNHREGWFRGSEDIAGTVVLACHSPCRRWVNLEHKQKSPEPVVPLGAAMEKADSVDPGNEYRLLTDGETIQAGDEIRCLLGVKWLAVESGIGKTVTPEYSDFGRYIWRRKVTTAVEPVRVGDRVEVLSGPWAGSVGVVCGTLPMNFKIKVDNVFVGGNSLYMIVGKSDVRKFALKSAQTVSDPEWRLLDLGETIAKGDEWVTSFENNWHKCCTSLGETVESHRRRAQCRTFQARRRVRIESPGWRYLDAGETVQAGDETWCQINGFGRANPFLKGSEVGNKKLFRRKTVPFAG